MKKLFSVFFTIGLFQLVLSYKPIEKNKPNILFLIADDAGPEMSCYGSKIANTPGIDRIAQQGVLFENAFTPNAKCAPSRASILTGRNSWQLDEGANHLNYFPAIYKTWSEVLMDQKYQMGFCGKVWGPGKSFKSDGTERKMFGNEYVEFIQKIPHNSKGEGLNYSKNFEAFLETSKDKKPWAFWLGFMEPHRVYEYKSGARKGKKTDEIRTVPGFLPDVDTVRNDLLDYATDIEYMDSHIVKILNQLEQKGELDNTLIIFTSDHGMPFPRVKGNQYYHSNHIPLVIMWGNELLQKGRKVKDMVNFTDLAGTFLEAAGISWQKSGMHPSPGKSLLNILKSKKSGQVDPSRSYVLVGQERHDYGRPNEEGYPIRGIQKNGFLYLKNYENSRWPACNPETGYLNVDGSPTKSFILNQRRNNRANDYYWKLCFGKRPAEELYDLRIDKDCINNLAQNPQYKQIKTSLEKFMVGQLKSQGDLRMQGLGHIYESYGFSTDVKGFYERFMKGEKFITGWVNKTDFEVNFKE